MTDLAELDGHRDGATYQPEFDWTRLNRQARAVFECLVDGDWWTLERLHNATGEPEASISARIRDFRKARFGGHKVERMRVCRGLYAYRMVLTVVIE